MNTPGNNIVLQVEKANDIFYHFIIPLSSKRLLNPDVEQVIVEEAEALPADAEINLVLNVTGNQSYDEAEIASEIKRHFVYQHERASKEVAETIRLGWKSLVIAFIFVFGIYFLSKLVESWLPNLPWIKTLRELFIVLGWVALWRPAEFLFYEWRPIKRKARVFERISKSNVQIVAKSIR